jgi:hypothetical protein
MKAWQTCLFALAMGCGGAEAWAQSMETQSIPLPAAWNNAYFSNSPDFFQGVNIWNQLNNIFGFNGYPEQQITRDTMRVTELYNQLMQQQVSADPTLRVSDANNPFTGSLNGSQPPADPYSWEPMVSRQPSHLYLPPAAERPVRGLW